MANTFKNAALCTAVLAIAGMASVASAQETNKDERYKPRVYGGQTTHTATAAPTTTVTTAPMTGTVILNSQTVTPAAATPAATQWPVDLSPQYTGFEGPVPVIVDPKCGAGPLELRVTIDNVKKTEGMIVADLHNDVKEDFLVGEKTVLRVRATATEDQTTFCFPLPKPGTYAIAIFHDKNGNEKFDKGFLGIPKERFGMSTNPKFGTRSPDFEESIFKVEKSMDIQINLVKASDVI